MSRRVHVHIDDRGISRALVDLWMPALDADVVWFVGPLADAPDDDQARDIVPFVPLEPGDVAAVASEGGAENSVVLAIFCSAAALQEAAMFGLGPSDVTIVSLGADEDTTRLSAEVHVTEADIDQLAAAEARGFTFELQPLPNVTARPWSPKEHRAATTPVPAEP